ncbi:muconate cycloisomerase family protein [Burkholderia sp. 22PA0099]|uniref:muconate cycloisomerase family protein n=1 Tax=Burkholderia sp. 22PA0099 TaxID=3237372 RepID=UPI0039C4B8AB
MQITSIESIVIDLPTVRPHKLAMATINSQSLVIVRVRDADGAVGLGEASVIPHYGAETVEAIKAVIDGYLAPAVLGADPANFALLHKKMDGSVKDNHYAKAAVEMACVDLAARRLGVASSALFGGSVRDALPVLLVLGNGEEHSDIALAEEKLEQRQHKLFLVKVGKGELRKDVERACAIKHALGDRARVHVDANQCWDESAATWAIERLEDAGIAVVEQPLPRSNVDGMRRLCERFTIPIMADEPIETVENALDFARRNAADAFSIKVTKHGGIAPTRKVINIAEAAGISLFGGTMLESGIGTAAYAQIFSTANQLDWGCQLFGPLLFSDSITVEQPEYKDFHLTVPQGPGFGMRIDEDKLSYYRRDGGRYKRAI